MLQHLNLQETNRLHRKNKLNEIGVAATLYNQVKMAQKLDVRYFKNVYYDNFDNLALTDSQRTTASVRDGALMCNPHDSLFQDNGHRLKDETGANDTLQVVKNGTNYLVCESFENKHTLSIAQNGTITRELGVIEGGNPHFIAKGTGFVMAYEEEGSIIYRLISVLGDIGDPNAIEIEGHTLHNPFIFLDNNEMNIFFDKKGEESGISAWTSSVITNYIENEFVSKPKLATITNENRIVLAYEDESQGFVQVCYRFLDDIETEIRITADGKTQKEVFLLSGAGDVRLMSVSDMENNYLDPYETVITSSGYINNRLTIATGDCRKVRVTRNSDNEINYFWVEDGYLKSLHNQQINLLTYVRDFDVTADSLQQLFVLSTFLHQHSYDTLKMLNGQLIAYAPEKSSTFYSLPIEFDSDCETIDLFISKYGDELEVKPFICFTSFDSDFIPLSYVSKRPLIENSEEHYRIKAKKKQGESFRIKFELTTDNKYTKSKIVDYGCTYH